MVTLAASIILALVPADIAANPTIVSVAVVAALALTLSPYVLVLGGLFLVFSAVSLPGPLKKLLPAPVVEVRPPNKHVQDISSG